MLKHAKNEHKGIQGDMTLLHLAIKGENSHALKTLLERKYVKKNLLEEQNGGKTPLMIAAQKADVKYLELLLKAKANTETTDDDEKTALHYAAQNGRIKAFETLLQWGANPNALAENQTPLGYASTHTYSSLETIQGRITGGIVSPPIHVLHIGASQQNGTDLVDILLLLEKQHLLHVTHTVEGIGTGALITTLLAVGYTLNEIKTELNRRSFKKAISIQTVQAVLHKC